MTKFRREHDSTGEIQVPEDKMWGAPYVGVLL